MVAHVLRDPALFGELFDAMLDGDPVVRMRAADAVEKVTAERPGLLQPYKRRLLGELARIPQQEVRWHVAQMLARLQLTDGQRERAVGLLLGWLEDGSSIVKTMSMQALADLAGGDQRLWRRVRPLLQELTRTGSPAMRARGRKLLRRRARQQQAAAG